jgi:hypothetical protein
VDAAACADRFAVDDVLNRFTRAVDTKQFDLLDEVFAADAWIDYTRAGGIADAFLPAVKAWIMRSMAPFTLCQHVIANRDITVDGDQARVHSYLYNPLGAPDADGTMQMYFVGGYYDDAMARTPDGWRITRRVAETVWSNGAIPDAVISALGLPG